MQRGQGGRSCQRVPCRAITHLPCLAPHSSSHPPFCISRPFSPPNPSPPLTPCQLPSAKFLYYAYGELLDSSSPAAHRPLQQLELRAAASLAANREFIPVATFLPTRAKDVPSRVVDLNRLLAKPTRAEWTARREAELVAMDAGARNHSWECGCCRFANSAAANPRKEGAKCIG